MKLNAEKNRPIFLILSFLSIAYILTGFILVFNLIDRSSGGLVLGTQTSQTSRSSQADFEAGTLTDLAAFDDGGDGAIHLGGSEDWWDNDYRYRKRITINNNVASQLASGYSVSLAFNHQDLVNNGKSLANGNDIRIVYDDGQTAVEIDRILDSDSDWNLTDTKIWFATQAAIPASENDSNYFLYYDNNSPGAVLADPEDVWIFWDDFSADTIADYSSILHANHGSGSNWTISGGYLSAGTDNDCKFLRNDSYSGDKNIYLETNITNSGYDDDGFGIGFYKSGSGNTRFLLIADSGHLSNKKGYVRDPHEYTLLFGDSSFDHGFTSGKYAIARDQNGKIYAWKNGSLEINGYDDSGYSPTHIGLFSGAMSPSPHFDYFLGRLYVDSEPTLQEGAEEVSIASSGSYLSPSSTAQGSGIIDTVWNGGWGDGTAGSTAFEAEVDIPANTSVGFQFRSSATGGADINWSDWYPADSSTYQATTSGTYSLTASQLSSVPIGMNRYLQIKITFKSPQQISNPSLAEYTIYYLEDADDPSNPNAINAWTDNGKETSINDNSWTNDDQPYFEFSGASDDDSGLAGYYVYFGNDNTSDPATSGSYQAHSGGVPDPQNYTPDQLDDDDSGLTFYLCLRTKDNAERMYNNGAPNYYQTFTYKFDNTKPNEPNYINVSPVGWSTVNNFDFSWPAAADPEHNGSASGVYGYQYKRGEGSGDDWSATITETSINDLEAYQNGQNRLHVRTVDNAGNISSSYATANYYYNADAPSQPQDLSVVPQNSEDNSFTFDWDKPASYNGSIAGYYYSVNNLPNKNNTVFTEETTTGQIAAATQQGFNTFYVVAIDDSDNINWGNYNSIQFECHTPAPGPPTNLQAYDNSDRDAKKYNVGLSWDKPGQQGVGIEGYSVERSIDGDNYSQVSTTSGTSVIDTSLSSITYYYRIKAYDNSGNYSAPSSVVSIKPTGRYTSPPDLTHGPTIDVGVSQATVSWLTSRDSTSFVEYGLTADYGSIQAKLEYVSDHEVVIKGLEPNSSYHYRVKWIGIDGNVGYSSDQTFRTAPAPEVIDVKIADIRLDSAIVSFETTSTASIELLYGKTKNFGRIFQDEAGGSRTKHTVFLTDLDHSSLYYLKIQGEDIDGNEFDSDIYSFETLKMPRVYNVRFDNLVDRPTTTVRVSWLTNVETNSIVEFSSEKSGTQERVESEFKTSHMIIVSDLLDNTQYIFRAKGRDHYGNEAVSDSQTIKTPIDTRAPEVSETMIESSIIGTGDNSKAQLVVSWRTDEPATSQVEYGVGVGGEDYQSTTVEDQALVVEHTLIISELEPSSTYHLRPLSRDQVGNQAQGEDNVVITGQRRESVFDIIINNLKKTFSFLGRASDLIQNR